MNNLTRHTGEKKYVANTRHTGEKVANKSVSSSAPRRKKTATRTQITQAGRERLARIKNQTADHGMTDAVNWAKMAEAGRGQAYTPEQEDARKLMISTEKQQSYQAGLGVNMQKRSAYGKKWKKRAASDAHIEGNKGKRVETKERATGTTSANEGSMFNQFKDTVLNGGDLYDHRGNKRTSQERKMARLSRTQKGWTKAAKAEWLRTH